MSRSNARPASSSSSVDVEHLAGQMLATLGISNKRPSAITTPLPTRQTRSSKEKLGAAAAAGADRDGDGSAELRVLSTPKSRTASAGSSVSRSRGAFEESIHFDRDERTAPLTAIRRPAPQQQQRISSTTAKSPKAVLSVAAPSRRKSAAPAEPSQVILEEDYATLVALLAAKDEEAARLKNRLEESEARADELQKRCKSLELEKEQAQHTQLLSPVIINAASTRLANGKKQDLSEQASVSRREMDDFKKQYDMQENLLVGFQRENEKATTEIEQLKRK